MCDCNAVNDKRTQCEKESEDEFYCFKIRSNERLEKNVFKLILSK